MVGTKALPMAVTSAVTTVAQWVDLSALKSVDRTAAQSVVQKVETTAVWSADQMAALLDSTKVVYWVDVLAVMMVALWEH